MRNLEAHKQQLEHQRGVIPIKTDNNLPIPSIITVDDCVSTKV